MKMLPPKESAKHKKAKPTPKRGKAPRLMPGRSIPKAAKADPDTDGDAGASEAAAAEAREPAATYMAAASRKSRPTVI
jgi:hypothetical protein